MVLSKTIYCIYRSPCNFKSLLGACLKGTEAKRTVCYVLVMGQIQSVIIYIQSGILLLQNQFGAVRINQLDSTVESGRDQSVYVSWSYNSNFSMILVSLPTVWLGRVPTYDSTVELGLAFTFPCGLKGILAAI